MWKWSNSKSIRFSGISGYVQISLGHHALVEMMAENGARPVEAEGRLRIGLIGVTVIVAGVFAVTIILYSLKTVLGIQIPYPNIIITITWALIALGCLDTGAYDSDYDFAIDWVSECGNRSQDCHSSSPVRDSIRDSRKTWH